MITLDNVKNKLKEDIIVQNGILFRPANSFKTMELLKEIKVVLSNGDTIRIPKGFQYDGPSTLKVIMGFNLLIAIIVLLLPCWFDYINLILMCGLSMVIFQGTVKSSFPGLVHDYLYVYHYNNNRKFCDLEFKKWLFAVNGTEKKFLSIKWSYQNITNWLMYGAVRLLGWAPWNK